MLKLVTLSVLVGACGNSRPAAVGEKETEVPVLEKEVVLYEPGKVSEDLVLAVEGGGNKSYLLNKQGVKLFTWQVEGSFGNDFQLLPNGNVLTILRAENPPFSFGGGYGGVIQILDPDQNKVWQYDYVSADYLSHHDVELLPNGNLLFLAWERIPVAKAQSAGAEVTYDLFPEKVVEVDPASSQIVWEWRSWDHIVQDRKPGAATFGAISENPAKIDINYALRPDGDIMHANGLMYDAEHDLIFLTINHYSEVWVVDHSTTMSEAAGDSGGRFSKGGDLIYRFGNPGVWGNGKGTRLFDRVHFPNLIRDGLPGAGNMLIYDNGLTAKKSTVYELKLPGILSMEPGDYKEPEVVWRFTHEELSYGRISGADRLSNGNTLICEGDFGFWEVTSDGEVVWKYKDQGVTFWRGYSHHPDEAAIAVLKLKERNQ